MLYHIYYLTGYVFSKIDFKLKIEKAFVKFKIYYKSKGFLLLPSSSALLRKLMNRYLYNLVPSTHT